VSGKAFNGTSDRRINGNGVVRYESLIYDFNRDISEVTRDSEVIPMRMKSILSGLVIAMVFAIGLECTQTAASQATAEFEVASIKVNVMEVPWQDTRQNCGLNGMGMVSILPGPRVRAQRALLSCIIQGAYSLRAYQVIGGPDWINSIHYDIDAKATNSTATPDQTRLMLQALLRDRFMLKAHQETRDLPLYKLTIAKGGVKLQPPKEGGCIKPGVPHELSMPAPPPPGQAPAPMVFRCGGMGGAGSFGGSRMDGGDVPISEFIRLLSLQLHLPVIDKTGLKGTFDIHLTYAGTRPLSTSLTPGDATPADSGPTIFDAIQEQLGLKLESSKGPTAVLVIDSAQKPSEN
jgi:uncharacterized protein (TIGR03435 family)